MNPEYIKRIEEMERKIAELVSFMESFDNAGEMSPQHVRTILAIVGTLRLSSLADVTGTDSASNGQVLKYNGTAWAPGTDNVGP